MTVDPGAEMVARSTLALAKNLEKAYKLPAIKASTTPVFFKAETIRTLEKLLDKKGVQALTTTYKLPAKDATKPAKTVAISVEAAKPTAPAVKSPAAPQPPNPETTKYLELSLEALDGATGFLADSETAVLDKARVASRMTNLVFAISGAAFVVGIAGAFFQNVAAGTILSTASAIGGGAGGWRFIMREREAYADLAIVRGDLRRTREKRAALSILLALPESPQKTDALVKFATDMHNGTLGKS